MAQASTKVAGIDTGKHWLDIAVAVGEQAEAPGFRVGNDPAGWQLVIEQLTAAGLERVGIEASGGYEAGVVSALHQAGVPIQVYQPLQVRLFARLRLRHAKTDKLDAALIAAFTASCHFDRLPAEARMAELAAHLGYIEQVEDDISRLKTRLEQQREPRLRAIMQADIKALAQRRSRERQRLEDSLRQHKDLACRLDLLLSIQGIGRPTALTLIIRLNELGKLSRTQIAALAGLAPFDRQSGQSRRSCHIKGGRPQVRTALYAAALPAAFRWNPALVRLYKRLTANGKPHKLALTACARKLLIFANTVLARQSPWKPQTSQS